MPTCPASGSSWHLCTEGYQNYLDRSKICHKISFLLLFMKKKKIRIKMFFYLGTNFIKRLVFSWPSICLNALLNTAWHTVHQCLDILKGDGLPCCLYRLLQLMQVLGFFSPCIHLPLDF